MPWRRIHDQESSLDRALKEHDKVSTKLDKAMGKKSNKANELQAELVQVDSSIASLTPMVYSTFQRLDEERLRGLKEACVRWATARADMASRDGARAEQAAARILSWEPQDEVVAVGLQMAQAAGGRSSSRAPPPSSTPPQSTTRKHSAGSELTPSRSPHVCSNDRHRHFRLYSARGQGKRVQLQRIHSRWWRRRYFRRLQVDVEQKSYVCRSAEKW